MALTKKQHAYGIMICLLLKKKLSRSRYTKKQYWVKSTLLNRPNFDLENHLLIEVLSVEGDFQNFTRLPYEKFIELHEKVSIFYF